MVTMYWDSSFFDEIIITMFYEKKITAKEKSFKI